MTRFLEAIRVCHNATVSTSEIFASSRSHAKVLAVCIEVIFLIMLLSAWPLWLFLLKVTLGLLAAAAVAEFVLRTIYWHRDKRTPSNLPKTVATQSISPRLESRCSDAQGQLQSTYIPKDQADRMALTILTEYSVSRNLPAFHVGKLQFRALERFIRNTLS